MYDVCETTNTLRRTICRHCRQGHVNRPRGLCWSCYYTPGVSDLYPSTSKHAVKGYGSGLMAAPLPPFPTTAAPGTADKLAVMEDRAKAGQSIYHPADARWPEDPRPLEWLGKQRALARGSIPTACRATGSARRSGSRRA